MTQPDPRVALAQNWPSVPVYVRVLDRRYGQTVWVDGRPHIEIAHDLDRTQQRCTLAHEMHHVELGPTASEDEVREATARWLLPDMALIGQSLHDEDLATAAQHLGVTTRVLNDRLTTQSPHEHAELGRYLMAGANAGAGRPPPTRLRTVTDARPDRTNEHRPAR